MFIGNVNILGRRTDGSIVYLLDTYTASVAYSLRQLKTGVTNVVRVRRASDNAESDFTADEITDGTLTTWTGANTATIVKWYNQGSGGSSYDAVQTSAASQAPLVLGGVVHTNSDGFPSIKFDGSNDWYDCGSPAISGDISVWCVAENNAGTQNTLWSDGSVSTNLILMRLSPTGLSQLIVGNGTGSYFQTATSAALNQNQVYLTNAFIDTSKNMTGYLDAVSTTGSTYTGAYTGNKLILGKQGVSTLYFNGDFTEMILYTDDQSANRTDIESDINTHYSIY